MNKEFVPLIGAANPHLQTILPKIVRKKLMFKPVWQRLALPDGDFIDLAWNQEPKQALNKPRVAVFHGLEGNINSPYAHGLLDACKKRGWLAVVMHFRGCSGEPNKSRRLYHSGETDDARYFLKWLESEMGSAPTAAVGFSLGGNMLGCYLGQEQGAAKLNAAAIISAPMLLKPCSVKLEHGLSRLYQHYLLTSLKQNVMRKLKRYPGSLPLSMAELKSLRQIREFDNIITAPIHGFKDADDYYQRCSAMPFLAHVKQPLLIIHAKDDPFMTDDVIPLKATLPNHIEYQLTERGGHVGFVTGTWRKPEMWLEQRITEWLSPFLR